MTFPLHRLTLDEFDELANGNGHIGSRLMAGQRSKRLLQIVAMLREVAARRPDTFAASCFAESYAALAAINRRSPVAVDRLLLHPQVGAWTAHTLRRLVGTHPDDESLDDDLGHFGAIAAAAALTAGEAIELTLRIRTDGTLMVPTFGLARLEAAPSWYRARTRQGSHDLELEVSGGTVVIPVRAQASGPTWWPLRRLTSTTDGCRVNVDLDDIDPYRDCRDIGARDRLPAEEAADWQTSLDEAWKLLCGSHRWRADPLAAGVTVLVPLHPAPKTVDLGRVAGLSATTSDACGAVALSQPPDGVTLAATLVHEFQHSKLAALLDLVPMYEAGAEAVFYAPWRVDPRPLHGLLHGTYAYLALVDFWQEHRLSATGGDGRVAQFEFARWRHAVDRTLRTLLDSGRLTRAGEHFVSGMNRRMARLRSLPVPQELELLARDARIDHWTSWRLRNLRPDPEEVAAWADAWLAGARRPPTLPRVAVVKGKTWSGTDGRLELTYRRLRNPLHFDRLCGGPHRLVAELPDATPADARYAKADYRGAVRLYVETLTADPDRVDAWAGLVLAQRQLRATVGSALVSHPEAVLALCRHLQTMTGTPPDIDALSDWLTSTRPHQTAGGSKSKITRSPRTTC